MVAPMTNAAPIATREPGPPASTAAPERPPKTWVSSTPACQLTRASTAPAASATKSCAFWPNRAQSDVVCCAKVAMLIMMQASRRR